MAKATDASVLDAALDNIASSTVMHLCSAQPANFAGIAAVSLGSIALAAGDFTKADGASAGSRKVTVAAKTGIPVGTSGTVNHVALATGSVLKEVTTCPAQALTAGNTASTPAFAHTIAQPT